MSEVCERQVRRDELSPRLYADAATFARQNAAADLLVGHFPSAVRRRRVR